VGKHALVARLGGDEFVILDDSAAFSGKEGAHQFAHAMAREIARPFELAPGITAQVGASIGMATVPGDATDIDAVLRLADAAMYDAKRKRKKDERGVGQGPTGSEAGAESTWPAGAGR
jgi:diguanylate cyclase (GGDEF)-like protein